MRQRIRRAFADGRLTPASALDEVVGVGPYIHRRTSEHLNVAPPLTVQQFFDRTRTMSTQRVIRLLHRALQNERGNQCVARRLDGDNVYHAQDINHHGYEALVTLLDVNRGSGVAYGPIARRMPRRSIASKECGCRRVCEGPCVRTADGACVPRRGNGFLGAAPHPNQIVRATNETERRRVRNASRTRMTNAARADAGVMADVRAGNRMSMRYAVHRNRMGRIPSPKVRLPNT